MIGITLTGLVALALSPQSGTTQIKILSMTLEPSADVWVYPHASDGGRDPFLRVWGAGGKAIAPNDDELPNFSYSYLKFALPANLVGKQLKSAKLVMTHIPDPAFTVEFSKEHPITVHSLGTGFEEKTWNYDLAMTVRPEPKGIFSSAFFDVLKKDGKEFTISFDLLKGPAKLGKAWEGALGTPTREIAFALAAPIDIAETGRTFTYKFYSREADQEGRRPKLVLEVE